MKILECTGSESQHLAINVDTIVAFYPADDEREENCHIVTTESEEGWAVFETFEEVLAKLKEI